MKLSLSSIVSLCSFLFVSGACAETLWVDGVSATGGWNDANKTLENEDDDFLCWAASASNLVAWWQAKYQIPAGIPNSIDAIWDKYKSSVSADVGGDTHGAIQWWLTGVYLPTEEAEDDRSIFPRTNTSTLPKMDGYYYDQYQLSIWGDWYYDEDERQWVETKGVADFLCVDYRPENITLSGVGSSLIELVGRGCGVGLSIASDVSDLAHAITLWGVEYEGDVISRLWLTDSDDIQYGYHQTGLFSVAVSQDNGKTYINTTDGDNWYTEDEKVYIDGIMAINPAVSTGWGMTLVPEPATATLSLLALAGLAVRRRRK